jgi:hypothetical protein
MVKNSLRLSHPEFNNTSNYDLNVAPSYFTENEFPNLLTTKSMLSTNPAIYTNAIKLLGILVREYHVEF